MGDTLSTKPDAPVKPGMTKALRDLPSSTVVHNVELRPGLGAQLCRSAGTSVTLIKNNPGGMSLLQLPSGAPLAPLHPSSFGLCVPIEQKRGGALCR